MISFFAVVSVLFHVRTQVRAESCGTEDGCCAEGWTGEYCDEQILPPQLDIVREDLTPDGIATKRQGPMYGDIPIIGNIERRDWRSFESTERIAEKIFNTFTPLILFNSPADEWPARGGG